MRERGLLWLSAEAASLRPPGLAEPPPPPETAATLWTLQGRDGARALAWSHAHGRWVQWLAS